MPWELPTGGTSSDCVRWKRSLKTLRSARSRSSARIAGAFQGWKRKTIFSRQDNGLLRQELDAGRQQTETVADPVLFRTNALLQKDLAVLKSRFDQLEKQLVDLTERNEILETENAEQRAELELMESEMERAVSNAPEAPCGCEYADRCQERNLCGKCILYVGGRTNLIRHYRSLVEKYGGQFLHHDGGVETSSKKLQKILPKADAVLFPVDCVSHEASLFVKNALQALRQTLLHAAQFGPFLSDTDSWRPESL